MMNSVSFTGRETMLTKGVKNIADAVVDREHEYLGASKIFKKSTKLIEDIRPQLADLEKSYAVSHGTPANEIEISLGKFLDTNA